MFSNAGARTEMPGCSLCMGNQAQVREGKIEAYQQAADTVPA